VTRKATSHRDSAAKSHSTSLELLGMHWKMQVPTPQIGNAQKGSNITIKYDNITTL